MLCSSASLRALCVSALDLSQPASKLGYCRTDSAGQGPVRFRLVSDHYSVGRLSGWENTFQIGSDLCPSASICGYSKLLQLRGRACPGRRFHGQWGWSRRLWGSLGVALGWLWGRIAVALGWLWGAYQLAINRLCGGFDVALIGFKWRGWRDMCASRKCCS